MHTGILWRFLMLLGTMASLALLTTPPPVIDSAVSPAPGAWHVAAAACWEEAAWMALYTEPQGLRC